jgi:hypothetical protein
MNSRHIDLLPGIALAIAAGMRPWLEATMARHMVIEIPLMFAIGWLAARRAGPAVEKTLARWNAHGISALLYTTAVSMFWMMPIALDRAVLDPAVGIIKVVSIVLAGFSLGFSWYSAELVVQSFFVFNTVSMLLTAGLLYQQAPEQLCSVYLAGQQSATGEGLVGWSLVILALWCRSVFRHTFIRSDTSSGCESSAAATASHSGPQR